MQSPKLDDGRELTPPESDATCKATEDEDYYFDLVTFEVEDRLFRVPSFQFFKESRTFSLICKLSEHVENGDPIKLGGSKEGFRSLLKILYPLSCPTNMRLPPPSQSLPSLSKDEWISVLTFASNWKFLHVRELAVFSLEQLATLTSLEKICLGRDRSIPSWVVDGFVGLVQATTITDLEALQIDSYGETTAYKLFRIRELRIAGELSSAKAKVEEIFKEELDRLRSEEKTFNNKSPKKKK